MLNSSRLIFSPLSWAFGLLDYSFYLLNFILGKNRPKFFQLGWGDLAPIYKTQEQHEEFLLYGENKSSCPLLLQLKDDDIQWQEEKQDNTRQVVTRQATFPSPLAHLLPEASKKCHFTLLSPLDSHSSSKSDPIYIVMLPATGEMGRALRLYMARYFARYFGWSSIIVTAPFYGRRKPPTQRGFYLETVSNLLVQAVAIIYESANLVSYLLRDKSGSKVCLTGFSWGAAMACQSSSVVLRMASGNKSDNDIEDIGNRLACAPYIGSATPAVLADGLLETSIDWDALLISTSKAENITQKEAVRQKLHEEFSKVQLAPPKTTTKDGTNHQNNKQPIGFMYATVMGHDHFIRERYSFELLEQIDETFAFASPSKFQTQWLPGGHVMAMLLRPWFQRKTIVAAVQALVKKSKQD